MPELPDVAGFQQYLDSTALRKSVSHTHVPVRKVLDDATPQLLSRRLKGKSLKESRRHGKYLFARAPDAGWLVMHFGMTGELQYSEESEEMPEHTCVALDFENGGQLAFRCPRKLGRVSFAEDVDEFLRDHDLGPDALDDSLSADRFVELLGDRRGSIKSALMDQSLIAGIGNIYSDEILFQAGLRPDSKVDQLSEKQVRIIYRVMRRVLATASRHGGDLRKLPPRYMLPDRSPHKPCPRCDGKLRKKTVSGRSAIYCPNCQSKP
ncbi:MAG: Fpg/Nei family DNA glycosylase [Phycisphaerae bacterium]